MWYHETRLKQLLGLLAVSCEPPSLDQLASWMGPSSSSAAASSPLSSPALTGRREVEALLQVLGSLFVIREEDGKVRGFHKSIYDWLLNAEVSSVNRSHNLTDQSPCMVVMADKNIV